MRQKALSVHLPVGAGLGRPWLWSDRCKKSDMLSWGVWCVGLVPGSGSFSERNLFSSLFVSFITCNLEICGFLKPRVTEGPWPLCKPRGAEVHFPSRQGAQSTPRMRSPPRQPSLAPAQLDRAGRDSVRVSPARCSLI